MLLSIFKSKIHRATVTQADLDYMGSLTLDPELITAARMRVHEKVHVLNITNGHRFETYIIKGEAGSGVVCLNGACARLGSRGDKVIVLSYAQMTPEEAEAFAPCTVFVDEQNRVTEVQGGVEDGATPLKSVLS